MTNTRGWASLLRLRLWPLVKRWDIKVRIMKGSVPKMKYSRKSMRREDIESIEIQREQIDVFKQLADFDVDSSELPDDVAFVFHNLHKCKGNRKSG